MTPSRAFLIIMVTLATGFLAACGDGGGGSESADSGKDGMEYAVYDASEPGVGDSALLSGEVLDQEGCLRVRDEATGEEYTPVFPRSMTAANEVEGGSRLELRGGAANALPTGAQLPDACPATGPFWVVVEDVG